MHIPSFKNVKNLNGLTAPTNPPAAEFFGRRRELVEIYARPPAPPPLKKNWIRPCYGVAQRQVVLTLIIK